MKLKESWKDNPLYKEDKVELVPTEWVWKYWGRDVLPNTNLSNGLEVDKEALWKNIVEEGLHDPLIMRVGIKNKKFRLEAGNHRIQVLHDHNVEMIPVTVQIQEECGPHVDNVMNKGTHNFDYEDNLVTDLSQEYRKPSDVFKILK